MTLQQEKEAMANRIGYKSWGHCLDHHITEGCVGILIDDVAKLYASSKTEALREINKELIEELEGWLKVTNLSDFKTASSRIGALISKAKQLNDL